MMGFLLAYQNWLNSMPQWVLLVDNEPEGMDIRVITTQSDEPFCEVRVKDQQFDDEALLYDSWSTSETQPARFQ